MAIAFATMWGGPVAFERSSSSMKRNTDRNQPSSIGNLRPGERAVEDTFVFGLGGAPGRRIDSIESR